MSIRFGTLRPLRSISSLVIGDFGAQASDAATAPFTLVTCAMYFGDVFANVSVAECWFAKFSTGVEKRTAAKPSRLNAV